MTECSSLFKELLQEIKSLSSTEKKSILERTIKLQEEVGELAEAVLVQQNSSGSEYKQNKMLSVEEELVDVIIVALDMFYSLHPNNNLLEELMQKKCKKWKMHQSKNTG